MEHNITTTYLLSGKGDQRIETIEGKQQSVPAWNQWCLAMNPARSTDIIASVKYQNHDLYNILVHNPEKSESFFDELASALLKKIQEKQQDVEAIEFEFEGYSVYLSNLIPPGTADTIEHYYWCVER